MAMFNCVRCLGNNWSYIRSELQVRATCKDCNHIVQWPIEAKKKMKEGSVCRRCNQGICVKKKTKKARVYSQCYYCPICKAMYFSEEFIVQKNLNTDLFGSLDHNKSKMTILDEMIINIEELMVQAKSHIIVYETLLKKLNSLKDERKD